MRPTRLAGAAAAVAILALGAWAYVRAATRPSATAARAPGIAAVIGTDDASFDQFARRRRHDEVERAIQRCMRASGFDYAPSSWTPPAMTGSLDPPADETAARARGYGISTGLEPQEPAASSLADEDGDAPPASLSEAQRDAWTERLGDPGAVGSCRFEAEREADRRNEALLGDLQELATALEDAAETSATLRQLDERWQRCMRRAGHDVDRPADVAGVIDEALDDARTGTGADGERSFDRDRLTAVQAMERSMAVADVRCHAPLADDYDDAIGSITERVRAEHAGEVERIRELVDGDG